MSAGISLNSIQVGANLSGWGHWTRILAIALHLPQVHFRIYHTLHPVPIPSFITNVTKVDRLETGQPIVCDRDWHSVQPYKPEHFTHSLCLHRSISIQPFDPSQYDRVLYLTDVDAPGDIPPIVLETPPSAQPFPHRVIASNEIHNCRWLQARYPNYARRTVYPITRMRSHIEHLVGIGGYNLFWECAYHQIPCTLYPSTWYNDSVVRMKRLGDRLLPDTFDNGAPIAAQVILEWWTSVAD